MLLRSNDIGYVACITLTVWQTESSFAKQTSKLRFAVEACVNFNSRNERKRVADFPPNLQIQSFSNLPRTRKLLQYLGGLAARFRVYFRARKKRDLQQSSKLSNAYSYDPMQSSGSPLLQWKWRSAFVWTFTIYILLHTGGRSSFALHFSNGSRQPCRMSKMATGFHFYGMWWSEIYKYDKESNFIWNATMKVFWIFWWAWWPAHMNDLRRPFPIKTDIGLEKKPFDNLILFV